MAINTFGITVATLTDMFLIVINSSSRPTTASVDNMITANSGYVNQIAQGAGIEPDNYSDPDDGTYQILRSMIIYKTISDIYASMNNGVEQATYYTNRYKENQELLMKYPRHVDNSEVGPNRSKVITYGSSAADMFDPVARKIVYANTGAGRGRCALSTSSRCC